MSDMRIEEHYGNKIICGPGYVEVTPGSRWQTSNGSVAMVTMVNGGTITYHMESCTDYSYDRDFFGFQTRFCKIVDHE